MESRSFEETIIRAISLGGDTDTIGAVTGALAGAWYGIGDIPCRWLTNLQDCGDDHISRFQALDDIAVICSGKPGIMGILLLFFNNKKISWRHQVNELECPPLVAGVRGVADHFHNNIFLPLDDPVRMAQVVTFTVFLVADIFVVDPAVFDRHFCIQKGRDRRLDNFDRKRAVPWIRQSCFVGLILTILYRLPSFRLLQAFLSEQGLHSSSEPS